MMRIRARFSDRLFLAMAMLSQGLVTAGHSSAAPVATPISFAREVRPILAENCFHCHGPDPEQRSTDLRLDLWDESHGASMASVVTVGAADNSELFARVTSAEQDLRMPPPDSEKSLSDEQIAILGRWIDQGANYERHWSFEPPQRPSIPHVNRRQWVSNPIDAFVLARLEAEGLEPSHPADAMVLWRRLWLDLLGLTPTSDEVAELEKTPPTSGTYRQQVDQLLRSPHFGERWGRVWLDAARYADSDGYEKDLPREVWMYRNWVIESINDDMPYDRFIAEQIAGDLLPKATQDQRVATGFLRNSMTNREGGIDPEQFRMEAMFDRMDAIGKSILGLTVQCAQCHNHKYDPLTQSDYYRMFALLNGFDEAEIAVYTSEELQLQKEILNQIAAIETALQRDAPDWRRQMADWEESLASDEGQWTIIQPQVDGSGGQKHYLLDDGSILAQGYTPPQLSSTFHCDVDVPSITAIRLELLTDPNLPRGGPGRSRLGRCALSEFRAAATTGDETADSVKIEFQGASADVNPAVRKLSRTVDDGDKPDRLVGTVEFAIDGDDLTAWCIDAGPATSNVPREAVFVLREPLVVEGSLQLSMTLVQKHGGRRFDSPVSNNLGRFRFAVTSAKNPCANPIPKSVRKLLAIPAAERTRQQNQRVFGYWRTTRREWQDANERIEELWRRHPLGGSQLAVERRRRPRQTFRLQRGDFLSPAELVAPGVPAFLHAIHDEAPDRLSLARWLCDRRAPTTARALVNRIWQGYFGIGLVATPEDFGLQGDLPSHPELLDWLAVELMDNNWSRKHIHRLIVTSSTYRQSSAVTPELRQRDPENRMLARGTRRRVDAEVVRDIALSSSGLLDRTIGGPSVYPPAPKFLFEQPASYEPKHWPVSAVSDSRRRSIYTFRFRSLLHPALEVFDATSGTTACVRRANSNTPLQALTTLNEPLFLECARSLANRTLLVGGDTQDEQLVFAFRSCLTRKPADKELAVLRSFLTEQTERFGESDATAVALIAADQDSPIAFDKGVTVAERAAWIALARVLLNLDETITKQ